MVTEERYERKCPYHDCCNCNSYIEILEEPILVEEGKDLFIVNKSIGKPIGKLQPMFKDFNCRNKR